MSDYGIICKTVNQKFDHDKNEYVTTDCTDKIISNAIYYNMTSRETIKLFKSLGATVKVTRKQGLVTKLISTSPSGELRTIRTFEFI